MQMLICAHSSNPNTKWSDTKCFGKGGYVGYNKQYTGCYTMIPEFWSRVAGQTLDFGVESCGNFGLDIATLQSELVKDNTNLGFESRDLKGWTPASSNTDRSTYVACNQEFGPAAEGHCYLVAKELFKVANEPELLKVDTVEADRLLDRKVHRLSRDIVIANPGGCNDLTEHKLVFKFRFHKERAIQEGIDLVEVRISDKDDGDKLLLTERKEVGSLHESGLLYTDWIRHEVQLGMFPAGKRLTFDLFTGFKNEHKYNEYQSTCLVDDVEVIAVETK